MSTQREPTAQGYRIGKTLDRIEAGKPITRKQYEAFLKAKDRIFFAQQFGTETRIRFLHRRVVHALELVTVPCRGEAHLPEVGGMIDNCWSCAPLWGRVPDKELVTA